MAEVLFYEKPGCINNTKQKQLLKQAGHVVIAMNLLEQPWSPQTLRPYFADKPIIEWFNPSAPSVRDGLIDPAEMDEQAALDAMINDPLLIRRPLMRVGDDYRVGFEIEWVNAWLGLNQVDVSQDIESCPRTDHLADCKR